MKKIETLFIRDPENMSRVTSSFNEHCSWVLEGDVIATKKDDGTACMIRDGKLYKRYDCKKNKAPPVEFEPCEPDRNEETGHWPGWVPVTEAPEDKWHREAFQAFDSFPGDLTTGTFDGTYELLGPKIQKNPERLDGHRLLLHGHEVFTDCPTDFDGLNEWFLGKDIEGIVWHHPDGRMCKIKKKDFGLRRSD